jgi:hypothetical protein
MLHPDSISQIQKMQREPPSAPRMLNLVPRHGGWVRPGKIVDRLLEGTDVEAWHTADFALLHELTRQGADVAQAFVGTPWMAEGLRRAGFVSRF